MNGLQYPKKSAADATNEFGDGDLRKVAPVTGGTSTSTGPTVSSRFYPKGKARVIGTMNPQKVPATKIYVGGID